MLTSTPEALAASYSALFIWEGAAEARVATVTLCGLGDDRVVLQDGDVGVGKSVTVTFGDGDVAAAINLALTRFVAGTFDA